MKKPILVLFAVIVVAMLVSNVYACGSCGRSPGWWKHNIRVAMGGSGSCSDGLDPAQIVAWVDAAGFATLQEAYDALSARGPGSSATRYWAAGLLNDVAF